MGSANIVYKGTSVNIDEVFPEQKSFCHTPSSQHPRVATCNNATQQHDTTTNIPIELQAQWMANSVVDATTGEMLEYRHLIRHEKYTSLWEIGMCRELGRLSQGFGETKGTSTIFFIPREKVPSGQKVTYMTIVCTEKPSKSDSERVRLCVGGDRLEFDGNIRTPTADLTTVKILRNSTIATKDERFMTMDIKIFHLGTPMDVYEYGRFHRREIPEAFAKAYELETIFEKNGYVYLEIQRVMYGLKHAGKIANDQLKERLIPHGYLPCKNTPGLWKHSNKPIPFTLIVDDVGVKYTRKKDEEELLTLLRANYEAVTTDWTGTLYSGITLRWECMGKRRVNLSMPGYLPKDLHQF